MTIPELLDRLRSLDVRIRLEGERLRYNAPKNALTPELRSALLERKPEIIAFLNEVGSRARAAFSPILAASMDKEPPLSSAQQRLWFIQQFEEGRPLYHIGAAVRLSGVLSPSALERSLNEIIRRHETLRSTFVTRDGKPLLQIAPALSLSLDMTDLSTIPPIKREEEVLRLAASEARRPFDLSQGPLLRTLLLRLDPVDHVVLLTMHHICSDGWSVGVLLRELSVLYEPFVNGHPSPLPELPVHYSDFSHWQREWLKGPDKDAQLAYWKERLSGLHPLPDLPADRPRLAVQTFRGALRNFTMPADLADSIASLCRREEVTPFMALLAVFQGLLYRYTGQEDLAVGTPIAGRNRAEVEPLIGCFVNTLVLRTDLSGNPTFRELLGRVREVTLGAYSHQDLPFDVLVSALQAQDGHGRPPLFQVMFILQNAPADPPRLPGMELTLMDVDNGSALFDLTLTLSERAGTFRGTFEYSRDLFDAATIERMVGHFETLTRSCLENPDRPVSEMALLREPERRQVLMEWNDTSSCFPSDRCIQDLFEEQVKRTPDALAVVYEDRSLTYGELNRRANQVARFLQQHAVGPDVPVGLCVDRSVEMAVGWLGILKAGGAYVPLDPSYPAERLSYMVEDSGVHVILTQSKFRGQRSEVGDQRSGIEGLSPALRPWTRDPGPETLDRDQRSEHKDVSTGFRPGTLDPGPLPPTMICLDTDWPTIVRESDENPRLNCDPSNLAYIIYTSGSTGRPKGVMIQHRSASHLATALRSAIYEPAGAVSFRVSLNAPLSFDASVQQLVMLLFGHTLCIVPQETRLDGEALLAFTERYGLDVLDCVPSQLKILLSAGLLDGTRRVPSIVLPGGEAIDESLWQTISSGAGTEFYNMYGPTECTVDSTAGRARESWEKPFIGRPLSNVRFYVLDPNLQPLPAGVPGELCIDGAGVGRGYFRRPDMTAEKFIPNPFGDVAGARLFRSGDLVRCMPDGSPEFVGRVDHMVKLRGFRIELGDIESVLKRHPGLEDAVALVREDTPGEKRLVAYVVGKEPMQVSDLRGFLKARLPNYMIPSIFVAMEALPLNPSGKVDRRALPVPDQLRPELDAEYVAPRTPEEEILAEIWKEVLGVKQVGIHDNFFELGGDSILSIQVVARAARKGLRFTAKELFEAPMVSSLAAIARRETTAQADQALVQGPVPLTPIQRRFFAQDLPEPHHWNQAVLLEVKNPLSPVITRETVACLMRHHDALRLRFSRNHEGWRQRNEGVSDQAPFSCIDLSPIPQMLQRKTLETCAAQIQSSLDLTAGPIFRVVSFSLGPAKSARLLLVVHHLAMDGVSWRILLEDFHTVYQQLRRGEAAHLPPKTTSYRQWATRLTGYAQAQALQEDLSYWTTMVPPPPLPKDFPEGRNTEDSERTLQSTLSIEETIGLLQEIPAAYGAEINEVLLAALAQALLRWTGSSRCMVDLEGHGRQDLFEDVDLSRTIGWFTCIHPVQLDLRGKKGPAELLKAVKEQLRRVPVHGFGYSLFRDSTEAGLSRLPTPEISFNYLGRFDQTFAGDPAYGPAEESCGPERSPKGNRAHLLGLGGSILHGRLHITWSYSGNLHLRDTIERLAEDFLHGLREIIAHCLSAGAVGYTPSDFPDVELAQIEVDALATEIREAG